MKKYIVSLIAAASMAATIGAQAAGTNLVQNVSISLEFTSQVDYTNNVLAPGFSLPFEASETLKTNKTARQTNIIGTLTETAKTVSKGYANKDIISAINSDFAGGTLVLVTYTTNGYNSESFVELRKAGNIYVVPKSVADWEPTLVRNGKNTITTNTLYKGANVTATTNLTVVGTGVGVGTFTLNTSALSCTISGWATETGGTRAPAGHTVVFYTTSAPTLAGSGTDADGSGEAVKGTFTVGAPQIAN
jgi:hypothetical protein